MAIDLHLFETLAAADGSPLSADSLAKASGADVGLLGEIEPALDYQKSAHFADLNDGPPFENHGCRQHC